MRKQGHSLIELAVGLIVLVPVILIIIDLVLIVIGVEINDNACREATRIAASGDPATTSQRIIPIIEAANNSCPGMVSDLRIVKVDLYPSNLLAQAAALQPNGGTISGSVTVNTAANVHLFVVQWVCSGGQPFTVNSTRSFPFTYIVPNTTIIPSTNTIPNTTPSQPSF